MDGTGDNCTRNGYVCGGYPPKKFFLPGSGNGKSGNTNQTPSGGSSPIGSRAKTRQKRSCRIA